MAITYGKIICLLIIDVLKILGIIASLRDKIPELNNIIIICAYSIITSYQICDALRMIKIKTKNSSHTTYSIALILMEILKFAMLIMCWRFAPTIIASTMLVLIIYLTVSVLQAWVLKDAYDGNIGISAVHN
jgi:hypothetical protein